MGGINRLIKNVEALDFYKITSDTLHATQSDLITNQQQQMLRGKRADGGLIGKYKDKRYRGIKFNMNPLAGYGNIDLRFTGEFQRNIKVFFFSRSFIFKSTDFKNQILLNDYGENIFGFNRATQKNYMATFKPLALQTIRTQILK